VEQAARSSDAFAPGAVIVITAISASGKSTVAGLLARRFARGVHLRGDAFRRMIVAGREEMRPDPPDAALTQLQLRYELAGAVADRYASAGFTTVLQDVVFGPHLVDLLHRLVARPRHLVVLTPNLAEVQRREAARAKVAYRNGGFSAADLDAALRDDTPRLGLCLDTTTLNADETVDVIVQRAADSLVDL
jgi:chloramphenicol 3-O-phosphotransferase